MWLIVKKFSDWSISDSSLNESLGVLFPKNFFRGAWLFFFVLLYFFQSMSNFLPVMRTSDTLALIDHFKVTAAMLPGVQIFWGERAARHKLQMVD